MVVEVPSPVTPAPTVTPEPTPTRYASPTPDPTRIGFSEDKEGIDTHVVQYGETLGFIALRYGTTVEALMEMNGLTNSDQLQAGQALHVEVGPLPLGPGDKLIPDSEFVYGPAFSHFSVASFADKWKGHLVDYSEEVEGEDMSGTAILQLVSQRYSVGPRLLLSLLELQAGWVSEGDPSSDTLFFPMGKVEDGYDGLFMQLSWTANQLNLGYYGWKAGWLRNAEFDDGTLVQLAPGLNAGTVAVQRYLALHSSVPVWELQVASDGPLTDIYQTFFGYPVRYSVEPIVPDDLAQPEMTLPWEQGTMWYVTSGPHGGWGSYSGWAALDFAPASEELGCTSSSEWVRAVCPGRVVRAENGEVLVDLDDDGFEGTGWTVLYMHIASDERVPVGTWLEVGDKIGHPSCEGGFSDGTHLHIARRYNGQWIEADGPIPFVMDGWTPISDGVEYNGVLIKGEVTREAWGHGQDPEMNGIVAGP